MNTECALLYKIPSPRAHSNIKVLVNKGSSREYKSANIYFYSPILLFADILSYSLYKVIQEVFTEVPSCVYGLEVR